MSKQKVLANDVLEANCTIADFMGMTKSFDTYFDPNQQCHFEIEDLEYHSSWDWQIPVYVKLSSELLKSPVDLQLIRLRDKYLACVEGGNIMQGHNYLVETIQWYNPNKQS